MVKDIVGDWAALEWPLHMEDELRVAMAKAKKPTAMEAILAEKINLGGEVMTRKEAYDLLTAEGQSSRCADYFAFHTETFTEQEIAQ
jgi:hypothetical protein